MAAGPRINLIALNAFPVIDRRGGERIGGLETFAWSLAQALAADGFETSLTVRVRRKPKRIHVDGVRLLVDAEPLRGIRRHVSEHVEFHRRFPWLLVRHWKPALIWQIPLLACARLLGRRRPLAARLAQLLDAVSPGVVLPLGVSAESAAALAAAKALGQPAVLWLQSNADLDERFFTDATFKNPYGVSSADAQACLRGDHLLIAQTEHQRETLRTLTGRECAVIQNPVDLEAFSTPADDSRRDGVLWIGRYDRFHKRPLLAIEIARRCPGVTFTFVLNEGDPAVAEEVRRTKPANVTILDFVPRDEMPARFRAASLFLSTGSLEHEGFPNVLLEAAAAGTPIVSLEDFDRFLRRSSAGISTSDDVSLAAAGILELMENPGRRKDHACAGRDYVERHHSIAMVLRALRPLLEGLRPTP